MKYLPLNIKQQTINHCFCLRYLHLLITEHQSHQKGIPPTVKHNTMHIYTICTMKHIIQYNYYILNTMS